MEIKKKYFFQDFKIFSNRDIVVVVVHQDDLFNELRRRALKDRHLKEIWTN